MAKAASIPNSIIPIISSTSVKPVDVRFSFILKHCADFQLFADQ